jgi:hypothetical protein
MKIRAESLGMKFRTERTKKLIDLAAGILFGLALGAALWAGAARAGTAVMTWQHPTTGTQDGATVPLPLSAIGSTYLEAGTCSGSAFGALVASQSVTAPATTGTFSDLAPGTYCFRAFTKTTASPPQSSGPSAVVTKTIAAPGPVIPNPPSVTVTTTAYERRLFRYRVVGTVPRGTPCSAVQGGYGLIPSDSVDYYRRPRGPVYGQCSG